MTCFRLAAPTLALFALGLAGCSAVEPRGPYVPPTAATIGSVRVDPRTELVYVVHDLPGDASVPDTAFADATAACDVVPYDAAFDVVTPPPDGGVRHRALSVVDPMTFAATAIAEFPLEGSADVFFAEGAVLLTISGLSATELRRIDPLTRQTTARTRLRGGSFGPPYAGYGQQPLSPSGRYFFMSVYEGLDAALMCLGADDDGGSDCGVDTLHIGAYLVDMRDLRSVSPTCDGTFAGSWLHTTDRMLAVSHNARDAGPPMSRVRTWDVRDVLDRGGAVDTDGYFVAPVDDFTIAGDLYLGSISPDDRVATVWAEGTFGFLDLASHAVRVVPGFERGSGAGFSPDGTTVVAWVDGTRPPSDGGTTIPFPEDAADVDGGRTAAQLVFIDVSTARVTQRVRLPFDGSPYFYTTRAGHSVLVTAGSYSTSGTRGRVVLVDMEMGVSVDVERDGAGSRFDPVERPARRDVWLGGRPMRRVDLASRSVESIDLGYVPAGFDWIPSLDLFVITRSVPTGLALDVWDPNARLVTRTVSF